MSSESIKRLIKKLNDEKKVIKKRIKADSDPSGVLDKQLSDIDVRIQKYMRRLHGRFDKI